jgi:hypothetical protein
MKLKLDAEGRAVLSDGKPVYVHEDGREVAFDAPATVATITRLNGEAKGHRERAEAAEGKLKAFDGIEDAEAAKKALQTMANLDSKKLIDAGEVDKVKAEAIKAVEEKYAPIVQKAEKLEAELYGEKIGGSFARSKFLSEKAAIPADLVQARFGSNFKIEDGKVVTYDQSGNKIYSRSKPGELADFEEGLETLIDAYPHKDQILKGTGGNGGGSRPSGGNGGGSDLSKLSPVERINAARAQGA